MRTNSISLVATIVACSVFVLPNVAQAQTRCPGLRALNGKCANPNLVEDAQSRAMIIGTVRNSYFGTPIGTVGGKYIPFERLFRDDPAVFGLPTYTILYPFVDTFSTQKTK